MFGGHKIISLCISKLNDERNYKFTEALNYAAVEKDYRLFIRPVRIYTGTLSTKKVKFLFLN